MRWPWVSRAEHERQCQSAVDAATALVTREARMWKAASAEWSRAAIREAERYSQLVERYHSLKLAGAVEVPKPPVVEPLKAAEPDELVELIHAKAGGDLRRRAVMLHQLKQDRRDRIADDVIYDRILNGVSSDGVPA